MIEISTVDMEALRGWIGRTETAQDEITPRLVRELNATLDLDAPEADAPAPLGVHWCLAPPAVKASLIGSDGHPVRGGFLPPVPLPRRMWAGGQVRFHDPLRVGDKVERRSRVGDVAVKRGRSGVLCFVSVSHEYFTARGLAVEDRQDVVYRDFSTVTTGTANRVNLPAPEWRRGMQADPVLLLRYSALTFNGHRIHYDRPYATNVEGYPGLIVHGPLQATLLIEFAASIKGEPPKQFHYRAVQPLFDFTPFELCARPTNGGLHLWIQSVEGAQTMDAQASW
ncbi:MAG: MaoC family dehydratase N-terminal domain-containing protein [Steroidobacteraceae bacterium]